MTDKYHQNTKKDSKKKHTKSIKIFLKKKKNKRQKRPKKDINILLKKKRKKKYQNHHERNKNLTKEQKKKLVEYRRNYHITHNEKTIGQFLDFLKILGQFNFSFHGLVLEICKNS